MLPIKKVCEYWNAERNSGGHDANQRAHNGEQITIRQNEIKLL